MLKRKSDIDSDTDWKSQYLQSVRELDDAQTDWHREKDKLYQALIKLAFIFQGENDVLDKKLFDLKDTVKTTEVDFPDKQIHDTVSSIQQATKESAAVKSRTSALITNIIDLVTTEPRYQKYRSVCERVKTDLDSNKSVSLSVLKTVNQLLVDINKNAAKEKHKPDSFKVFLKKLAMDKDTPAELATLCKESLSIASDKEITATINQCIKYINQQPSNTQAAKDDSADNQAVVGLAHVLTLLDWVTIPGKSQLKLDKLKEQLEQRQDSQEIASLLRRLALTMSNAYMALQSDLTDAEGFLKNITQQLNEITLQIADIETLENDAFAHSSSLNEEMDKQMQLMRDGIDEADSLEKIKATINKRMEVLQENMDQFISAEQQRRSDKQDQTQLLIEKLGKMEKESETLRQCIEQEKLKAYRDALTRIPNRMAFDDRIAAEFKRWKRHGKGLCLCLIDIDKFKGVNDTYGHKAGDIVLRTVAEKCHDRVRETDFFCRYGGEEFALILTNTDISAALNVADSLRLAIEKCPFQYKQQNVPITISCGLAEFKVNDTIDQVFVRADKALYSAKESGRNRCVADKP